MTRSEMLFKEAARFIPGGVNSPVRAFGSVGETPRFIASAKGAYMTDVDGNTYLDFVGSWGPMILGHSHPAVLDAVLEACREGLSFGAATEREVEMAELAGCYHGHSDSMLVKAGSGVMTAGIPDSAGVPEGCTRDTLTAVYNDLQSVEDIFGAFGSEIAAVIVEPVAANMGVVLPEEGFLAGLRRICDEYGALLIFDEVITGFRLSLSGAQGYFGVRPDLTTFGKIIGGGMPVGAYGGRKDVMELIAPSGPVYQAGTLSGNPVAMAAGLAQLKLLRDTPDFYEELNRKGDVFFENIKKAVREAGKPWQVNYIGSLGCIFFTDSPVENYAQAKTADTKAFAEYFSWMLGHGIYVAPSQFEAMFLSSAMTEEELAGVLETLQEYLNKNQA